MAVKYRLVYNPLSWKFDQVPVAWTWEWDFVVVEPSWTIDENLIPESVSNYQDYEATTSTWSSVTINEKDFLINFTPDADFSINKWNVIEWTTYVLRVHPDSNYNITLWTWVVNPFDEDLTLTANKTTMIVLFAVDNWLELQSVRTFA